MSENLQQKDLEQTEFPWMSSLLASPVRTFPSLDTSAELKVKPGADFTEKSSALLATYDPNSSSWRTSQLCFADRVNNPALGLAEYSETWPNSGLMLSGRIYQLGTLASLTIGSVYGLLPTPLKSDMQANFSAGTVRKVMKRKKQEHLCYRPIMLGWDRLQIVTLYETVMGFPSSWVASMLSETQ